MINLRLKSNPMYWLKENAGAMFAIRASMLSDRWDNTLSRVRRTMDLDRLIHWRWTAPDPTGLNVDHAGSPLLPQILENSNMRQHATIAV